VPEQVRWLYRGGEVWYNELCGDLCLHRDRHKAKKHRDEVERYNGGKQVRFIGQIKSYILSSCGRRSWNSWKKIRL
jgi:hypothetical protein